jgi:DNA-binding IclR family transcriptional regulator
VNEHPASARVPDWLLGGNRKRRVLDALADTNRPRGWSARELTDDLGCGRSTVYEILRALRGLGVLKELDEGRLGLDRQVPLGEALARFLDELSPFADQIVDRPPRARDRR